MRTREQAQIEIYANVRLVDYFYKQTDLASFEIVNTYKLEESILEQLTRYYCTSKRVSLRRAKYIIDREIASAKKRYRQSLAESMSSRIKTDKSGDEYEDEVTDFLTDVESDATMTHFIRGIIKKFKANSEQAEMLRLVAADYDDKTVREYLSKRFSKSEGAVERGINRFRERNRKLLKENGVVSAWEFIIS